MTCPDGLDQIDITGISGFGYHGVFEHEKRDGQTFIADVSVGLDLGPAAISGDLSRTVDYGALSDRIHARIVSDPVDLIESVALRMVELCLETDYVQWAKVTVHKPEAPIAVTFSDVAVTIERSRT